MKKCLLFTLILILCMRAGVLAADGFGCNVTDGALLGPFVLHL